MCFVLFLRLTHILFVLVGHLLVVMDIFSVHVDFVQTLFEATNGFTHRLTQLRQAAWAEEDQKDNSKKKNVCKAKLTHGGPPECLKVYTF